MLENRFRKILDLNWIERENTPIKPFSKDKPLKFVIEEHSLLVDEPNIQYRSVWQTKVEVGKLLDIIYSEKDFQLEWHVKLHLLELACFNFQHIDGNSPFYIHDRPSNNDPKWRDFALPLVSTVNPEEIRKWLFWGAWDLPVKENNTD